MAEQYFVRNSLTIFMFIAFKRTNYIPQILYFPDLKKLEEIRLEKEHQFQIGQARIENERKEKENMH